MQEELQGEDVGARACEPHLEMAKFTTTVQQCQTRITSALSMLTEMDITIGNYVGKAMIGQISPRVMTDVEIEVQCGLDFYLQPPSKEAIEFAKAMEVHKLRIATAREALTHFDAAARYHLEEVQESDLDLQYMKDVQHELVANLNKVLK